MVWRVGGFVGVVIEQVRNLTVFEDAFGYFGSAYIVNINSWILVAISWSLAKRDTSRICRLSESNRLRVKV